MTNDNQCTACGAHGHKAKDCAYTQELLKLERAAIQRGIDLATHKLTGKPIKKGGK